MEFLFILFNFLSFVPKIKANLQFNFNYFILVERNYNLNIIQWRNMKGNTFLSVWERIPMSTIFFEIHDTLWFELKQKRWFNNNTSLGTRYNKVLKR